MIDLCNDQKKKKNNNIKGKMFTVINVTILFLTFLHCFIVYARRFEVFFLLLFFLNH